jgi:hypothetical protein
MTLNSQGLALAGAAVGIHDHDELVEFLGVDVVEPVTVQMIAAVLSQLPVTFDSVFSVA